LFCEEVEDINFYKGGFVVVEMTVERKYYSKYGCSSNGVFVSKKRVSKKRVGDILKRLRKLDKLGVVSSECRGYGRVYFLGKREDGDVPRVEHKNGNQPAIVVRGRSGKELSEVAGRLELRI
jgi:hypothetical protein